MGSCLSCRLSSSSSETKFNTVRVVHLNGYVEDFDPPVSVGHVTGKPSKHFIFTPAQLLSNGSKPMRPDSFLEPGRVYLLLPYSALQPEVSPLDLASVAKKLTALARTGRAKAKESPGRFGSSPAQYGGSSPIWSSPARSPNRYAEPAMNTASFGVSSSARARSWKPILDTIREKSFTRRSESDLQLQENRIEAANA